MPGPLPSDPGGQRRPNRRGRRTLPAVGRPGRPPKIGTNPSGQPWKRETREWWKGIWASPMATEWIETDVHILRLAAAAVDQINRGQGSGALLKEVRLLASEFGLSPTARKRLGWEVESDPAANGKGEVSTTRRPAWIPDPRDQA